MLSEHNLKVITTHIVFLKILTWKQPIKEGMG